MGLPAELFGWKRGPARWWNFSDAVAGFLHADGMHKSARVDHLHRFMQYFSDCSQKYIFFMVLFSHFEESGERHGFIRRVPVYR